MAARRSLREARSHLCPHRGPGAGTGADLVSRAILPAPYPRPLCPLQVLTQLRERKGLNLQPEARQGRGGLHRALDEMVAAHLRACGFSYSLSVFQPESGVGASNGLQFSEAELLQQLNVHPSSPLGQRFGELWAASGGGAAGGAAADGRSFALVLLQSLAEVQASAPRHEAETQTRNGPAGSSLNDMSIEMERLEAKFAARLERQRTEARLDFDRQMSEHHTEADRIARAELDARVEKVREIEVGAARISEAARYQEKLAQEKAEMEKLHRFQLSKLREKEIQMTDRLMQQQRKIDAMEFDHRGQVERESAELQVRRAEHEAWASEARASTAAREAALEEREQKLQTEHRLRTLDLEKQLSRAAREVAEARDYRERVRAEVLAEVAKGLPPQHAAAIAAAAAGIGGLSAAAGDGGSETPLSVLQVLEKRVTEAEGALQKAEAAEAAQAEECENLRRELQARPAAGEIARARAAWEQERRIWAQREEAWQGALAQANQVAREATDAQEDAVERLEEIRFRATTAERDLSDSRRTIEHLRRALEAEGVLAAAGLTGRGANLPTAQTSGHDTAAPVATGPVALPRASPQHIEPAAIAGITADADLGSVALAEEEAALRQRSAGLRERAAQQQATVRAAAGHFHERLAALHGSNPELSPGRTGAPPAAALEESSAEDVAADIAASFAADAVEMEAETIPSRASEASAKRSPARTKLARAGGEFQPPQSPGQGVSPTQDQGRSPKAAAQRRRTSREATGEPAPVMGWGSFAAELQDPTPSSKRSPIRASAGAVASADGGSASSSGPKKTSPEVEMKPAPASLPGQGSKSAASPSEESLEAKPASLPPSPSKGSTIVPTSKRVASPVKAASAKPRAREARGPVEAAGGTSEQASPVKRRVRTPARAPLPVSLATPVSASVSPPAGLRPVASPLARAASPPGPVPVPSGSITGEHSSLSSGPGEVDEDLDDDSFGGSDLLDMLPDGGGSPVPPLAPQLTSPVGGRVGAPLPPRSPVPLTADPAAAAAEALIGLPPTPPGRSPGGIARGSRGSPAVAPSAGSPLLGAAPVLLPRERSGASFADSEPAESVEEELSAALLGSGDSPLRLAAGHGAVMQALPSEPSRASPEQSVVEIDFGDVSLPDAGFSPMGSATGLGGVGGSGTAFGEESEISVASHRFSGALGTGDSGSDERLSGGSSGSVF